jgi:phosphatidate phosphatase APP1
MDVHSAAGADSVKSDEQVLFYPTFASPSEDGGWSARIHGWIYEPEEDDLLRIAMQAAVRAGAQQTRPLEDAEEGRLAKRLQPFLVDNERSKSIAVTIADRTVTLEESAVDGHFFGDVTLSPEEAMRHAKDGVVAFRAVHAGDRVFEGTITLVPAVGLSVISDIDDTIRVTEVRKPQRMIARTFLEEFEAAPGMSDFYQKLHGAGAVFHYVSAAPWQLFVPLDEFRTQHKFPPGEWSMKRVRLKDRSVQTLFASPEDHKIPIIEEILKRHPQRTFLLIGDSGERDPEIFGRIARKHQKRIDAVYIRNVSDESTDNERMRSAFRDVSPDKWSLFTTPETLDIPERAGPQ